MAETDPRISWANIDGQLSEHIASGKKSPWPQAAAQHFAVPESSIESMCITHRHCNANTCANERRAKTLAHTLIDGETSPGALAKSIGIGTARDGDALMKDWYGVTAAEWRAAQITPSVKVRLPVNFRAPETLGYIGRDPKSNTQWTSGTTGFCFAFRSSDALVRADVSLKGGFATADLSACEALPPNAGNDAVIALAKIVGRRAQAHLFEARSAHEPAIKRLTAIRPGLRITRTLTAFDAIVWSIIGQQISLPFAYQLLRELVEMIGEVAPGGLRAMPLAHDVAQLDESALINVKFSRAKASYLVGIARQVSSGELDLVAAEENSAVAAYSSLESCRGLGPWSVNYVMMRGMGFGDCAPIGDAGLRRALAVFEGLSERLTDKQMAELMVPFAPHRSLATFHMWRSLDNALGD